jgi:23S rRNA maturation mini-RNase III
VSLLPIIEAAVLNVLYQPQKFHETTLALFLGDSIMSLFLRSYLILKEKTGIKT